MAIKKVYIYELFTKGYYRRPGMEWDMYHYVYVFERKNKNVDLTCFIKIISFQC